MLTPRAWWFLLFLLVLLTIGLFGNQPVLAAVALTLLLWLTGEGLWFLFRVRIVVSGLSLERHLRDDHGRVTTLWAGRPFEVRTALRLRSRFALPYAVVEEMVPFGLEPAGGSTRAEGDFDEDEPLRLRWKVRPRSAGRVRFEGAKVQLADLHGFFYHSTFVRAPAVYLVLPALADADARTATAKRYNLLPPPGINRFLRPGSGSELLDLRDYLPGDPPKTIAWKVSARRDRLITREYESEVPVRCTLFVDTSNSVRLGPLGQTPLARLVEIAAAVAQANLGVRDLTGLCLFDETRVSVLRPARTRRQLIEIPTRLADAASLTPEGPPGPVEPLLPLAFTFAEEVYPEQMHPGVNSVPWWFTGLVSVPGPWVTPRTRGTWIYRLLTLPLAGVVYVLIWLGLYLLLEHLYFEMVPQLLVEHTRATMEEVQRVLPHFALILLAVVIAACLGFPLYLVFFRDVVPLLFATRRRRLTMYRKRLAALLAVRYGLGPGALELLLRDDARFGEHLQRFLSEHRVPHTPALVDPQGRFCHASPGKVDVLARSLLEAVGKGHDNEMLVLLVDLMELEDHLGPLLKAIKVALARHHQVLLICPWPQDLPPPGEEPPAVAKMPTGQASADEVKRYLQRVTAERYHQAYHRIRRAFGRIQVPVMCAASQESVRLILDRIDRLRSLRRRR